MTHLFTFTVILCKTLPLSSLLKKIAWLVQSYVGYTGLSLKVLIKFYSTRKTLWIWITKLRQNSKKIIWDIYFASATYLSIKSKSSCVSLSKKQTPNTLANTFPNDFLKKNTNSAILISKQRSLSTSLLLLKLKKTKYFEAFMTLNRKQVLFKCS